MCFLWDTLYMIPKLEGSIISEGLYLYIFINAANKRKSY